jgi:predicted nucleic-acid-binding protein
VIRREAGAGEPVLISLLVILETEWVLRSRYDLSKAEILTAFSGLLESVEISFEDESSLEQALFLWKESSAQFADCLIGARNTALSCRGTATFDAKALRVPGFIAA